MLVLALEPARVVDPAVGTAWEVEVLGQSLLWTLSVQAKARQTSPPTGLYKKTGFQEIVCLLKLLFTLEANFHQQT